MQRRGHRYACELPANPIAAVSLSLLSLAVACSPESAPSTTTTVEFEVSEGTRLSFDLSPDGETIVFDLLGQLWLMPSAGGEARPLTDAVRDTAQDRQPAFSPDGEWIVFRSDRPAGTGLWLVSSAGGVARSLTRGNDLWPAWSPDGRRIAFTRDNRIHVYDLDDEAEAALPGDTISTPGAKQADWSPDGRNLVLIRVGTWAWEGVPGPVWEISVEGGEATPLTPDIPVRPTEIRWTKAAWSPTYAPDGMRIAFFLTEGDGRPIELHVLDREHDVGYTVASHRTVDTKRVRWAPDGASLYYAAEGALWHLDVRGTAPARPVPFTAKMSFERPATMFLPLRLAEPGSEQPARGFTGLEISPSGDEIAILALGHLWIAPVGGDPRRVADVPFLATGLSWSADGGGVVWSAGAHGEEDLFETDVATGVTRRLTDLRGREVRPSHSPDGRHIAFVQVRPAGEERVRVIPTGGPAITRLENARDLGGVPATFGSYSQADIDTRPQWSPDSRSLLLCSSTCRRYDLDGGDATEFTDFDPARFLRWRADGSVLFDRDYTLWTAEPDSAGTRFRPAQPLLDEPALYPSVARDGSILYISDDGLRVRRPDGQTTGLGWPLTFAAAEAPAALLLQNARIIDGTGTPPSGLSDILIEGGRIAVIRPAGQLDVDRAERTVDLAGRTVMPGLISIHDHIWDPALLPGLLYHGITTVRDPGSPIAWTAGRAEMVEAGLLGAPRIVYSGLQLHAVPREDAGYTSASTASLSRPEAAERAIALADAFGAGFVKLREVWDVPAALPIIDAAHRRGLSVTGHNVGFAVLVAAGMDGWEHAFGGGRDDIIRMVAAAGIWVGPNQAGWASRGLGLDSTVLDRDDTAPFLSPAQRNSAMARARRGPGLVYVREGGFRNRDNTRRVHEAGMLMGIGTDMGSMALLPWEPHNELVEFVDAGLSPMQAIVAATRNGAEILGALDDLGTIEEGRIADLIILDRDPLEDIHNTRSISMVVHGGRIVDRVALRGWLAAQVAALDSIR